MNTRDYKLFAEGEHYHIYNRGVAKMDIFKDNEDYMQFLIRLKLSLGHDSETIPELQTNLGKLSKLRIKPVPLDSYIIVSYCLMPNHFHFLIQQKSKLPVNRLISKVCTSYAMYFNLKYKRVGPIFQDTFKAVHVDENSQLLWLSAYIHQNPAVAGLVWDLREWKWSNYLESISEEDKKKPSLCNMEIVLGQYKHRDQYREFVETSFDEIARVKKNKALFD